MAYTVKRGEYAGQVFASERQYRNQKAFDRGYTGAGGTKAGALDKLATVRASPSYQKVRETVTKEIPKESIIGTAADVITIADYAAHYDKSFDVFVRDYDHAINAENFDIDQFNELYAAVQDYFTKETYDDAKATGGESLHSIPGMDEYLDFIGVDAEDYEIWYH